MLVRHKKFVKRLLCFSVLDISLELWFCDLAIFKKSFLLRVVLLFAKPFKSQSCLRSFAYIISDVFSFLLFVNFPLNFVEAWQRLGCSSLLLANQQLRILVLDATHFLKCKVWELEECEVFETVSSSWQLLFCIHWQWMKKLCEISWSTFAFCFVFMTNLHPIVTHSYKNWLICSYFK